MTPWRPLALVALIAASAAASSSNNQPQLPDKATASDPLLEQLRFQIANGKRMKAAVRIGSGQSLNFIVDTGAERSAIATEAASELALPTTGVQRVISFDGAAHVRTVKIPQLQLGDSRPSDVEALTFNRDSLGADGLLGIDTLRDRVVTFDFDNREMRIEGGGRFLRTGTSSVRLDAARRDGRLVFSTARVDRVPTVMILDTGSDLTVGNEALRRRLMKTGQMGFIRTVRLLTTTGQVMRMDYTVIHSAEFGGVRMRNLPIAFSTTEPFQKLGLSKRPAMLLGMDALQAFGEVAVDFRHEQVRFSPKKGMKMVSAK